MLSVVVVETLCSTFYFFTFPVLFHPNPNPIQNDSEYLLYLSTMANNLAHLVDGLSLDEFAIIVLLLIIAGAVISACADGVRIVTREVNLHRDSLDTPPPDWGLDQYPPSTPEHSAVVQLVCEIFEVPLRIIGLLLQAVFTTVQLGLAIFLILLRVALTVMLVLLVLRVAGVKLSDKIPVRSPSGGPFPFPRDSAPQWASSWEAMLAAAGDTLSQLCVPRVIRRENVWDQSLATVADVFDCTWHPSHCQVHTWKGTFVC